MKEGIHPAYHDIEVTCACGNTFKTGSCANDKNLKIDICNKCHPFFTGQQKIVDTGGRVGRFQDRIKKSKESTKSE